MDHRRLYLYTLVAYATSVQALTSFDTNCTLPDHEYNYVQGPNVRGSLQIVWSCLATLIACTYSVLHLNVPMQRDGRDGAYARYLRTSWQRGNPSIMRATITATSLAYPWLEAARASPHLRRSLRMLGPKEGGATGRKWTVRQLGLEVRWFFVANSDTVIHFLATMLAPEWYALQAIYQRTHVSAMKARFEGLRPDCHPTNGWTLTHTYFADMGSFVIRSNVDSQEPVMTHLTARTLLQLVHQHYQCIDFESIPSREELQDRSKSDAFAKSLVILQIVWFTISCSIRLARGLSTTQLEMSILGTASCSLVSYFTIFGKPHAVQTAT